MALDDGGKAQTDEMRALGLIGEEDIRSLDQHAPVARLLLKSAAMEARRQFNPEAFGPLLPLPTALGQIAGQQVADQVRPLAQGFIGPLQMLLIMAKPQKGCQNPLVVGRRMAHEKAAQHAQLVYHRGWGHNEADAQARCERL